MVCESAQAGEKDLGGVNDLHMSGIARFGRDVVVNMASSERCIPDRAGLLQRLRIPSRGNQQYIPERNGNATPHPGIQIRLEVADQFVARCD